ncbi:hypothetical protein P7K49_000275 [Saguinus oedipus]|uniref:Uncharacterized protein n=1 Tax=Saguinus oedipus TaxID=9490 RepID=A0ABQ9WB76_SAGOE|nr:hypothetical protein P7K49_000275 [Saguinus oedipus]
MRLERAWVAGPQRKFSWLAEEPPPLAPSPFRPAGRLRALGVPPPRRAARQRPRPRLAPLGSRPALATNFAQVSGAAAPLSARSRERAPASPPRLGPLCPSCGGAEVLEEETRALPTPTAQGAPSRPRPPSAPAQVSVATCVCALPEPALTEEVEPGTPGGRRDQRSRLPLPHPQDLELTDPLRPSPPAPSQSSSSHSFSLESRFRRSAHYLALAIPGVSPGYPGVQQPWLRPREEEGGGQE